MDFNFNELGLSISHTIGTSIQPYADWFHNKSRRFVEKINKIIDMDGISSNDYVTCGEIAVSAEIIHNILSPDADLSAMDQEYEVSSLLTGQNVTVSADEIINQIETTEQTTELLSCFCDALKGSVSDDNLKLSVFESTISSRISSLTADSKNFLNFLRNLMLDGVSTGLDKVKMAINFIKPTQTSTTSMETESSNYTGCCPVVAWSDVVFSTLANVVPTIVSTASMIIGGLFGVLMSGLYSIGSYCINALRTGGSSLALVRKANRYSDFGIGNDIQWYRIISTNQDWFDVSDYFRDLNGYNGTGSILSIPMLGSSVYLRYDGSGFMSIGFRYQFSEELNNSGFYLLISNWLQAREALINQSHTEQQVLDLDETWSQKFKSMEWTDIGMESSPEEDDETVIPNRVLNMLLPCIAIHLCWYKEKYDDAHSGADPLFTIYANSFSPTIIDQLNNWRDNLTLAVKAAHQDSDTYDVSSRTNKSLYLLCSSSAHSYGSVDLVDPIPNGFITLGYLLKMWFINLNDMQDQYFIPHYWLESFPAGIFRIKTDSALALEYGAIVTASAIAITTSLIKIGLLAAKSVLRKKAFAARRNADIVAFDETATNKQAWKANKRASLLENFCGVVDDTSASVSVSDSVKAITEGTKSVQQYITNPAIYDVQNMLGNSGSKSISGLINDNLAVIDKINRDVGVPPLGDSVVERITSLEHDLSDTKDTLDDEIKEIKNLIK